MVNILLGLLAKEPPPVNAVMDCREVTHRDLSIIEVRYVQGGEYIAARSYATSTWVAKTPLGPDYNEDGTIRMNCVSDVAELQSYVTPNALRIRQWPTVDSLIRMSDSLDRTSFKLIQSTYQELGDRLYKTSFSFVPTPTILISLADGKQFKSLIGTVALDVHGNLRVASKVRPEVDDIVKMMRGLGRLALPEELYYE